MNSIKQFLQRLKRSGKKRSTCVKTLSMGKERVFTAYDLNQDTFIIERGVERALELRPSVLIVNKSDLKPRAKGKIFTLSTGNHSVAAFPLLDGRFWHLSNVPAQRRGDVLMSKILCANVVKRTIEFSQREITTRDLVIYDEWLRSVAALQLYEVVMAERNDATLEYFRHLGQEWRVKPLAWTENEMRVALRASKKKIGSKLSYYHSAKGVHFLTFPEFKRFSEYAGSEPDIFIQGIKELASVFEGNRFSFTRMPKYRGHHEIEFFGIKRGQALETIIPEIEALLEDITLERIGQLGLVEKTAAILAHYEALLTNSEFIDEGAKAFVETLYMHITGEVYSVIGDGSTIAFDDRRTALPGATFVEGRPIYHLGTDDRSELLLSNLRAMTSKDEVIEYANVYELRGVTGDVPLGKGSTREIVYKTNRCPIEHSFIEKRLSKSLKDYGSYMLTRVESFKALGIALSDYRLLRRHSLKGKKRIDYFIRRRCEGEPIGSIPANYFSDVDDSSREESSVVLALAALMGDAAAQNMAMKKYDPESHSPRFGIGKEIYEFEYDIISRKIIPKKVSTCSIRGSLAWPNLEYTDENLTHIANFYLLHYAHALKEYQKKHRVPMRDVAAKFMDGFEYRTHAMAWELAVMRDKFESFKPSLPKNYGFEEKWRFAMWSLERQERRLALLRKMFFKKVEIIENEDIRSDS
ncbi:MAG: hypothetical protein MJ109_01140 [Kiritimatiellae bacterium]|nr:hypothetical protein [Kiritimatiellia bacterium]